MKPNIRSQVEEGKIRRGSDMPCPTCGKKFVGFDVGTGIVYLCPRCKTAEEFEEDLQKLDFREVGMNRSLTDRKSGKVLLRYKVDDDRRLVLYSLADPDNPRAKDALFALTFSFDVANAGPAGGYEMLDVNEHRRDITTTKCYVVQKMVEEWRETHPDEVNT